MSSEEDLPLKRSSNRGRRTIFKVVTFPFAVLFALTALIGYVGGILLGWPGAAWVVCRVFGSPHESVEDAVLDDSGPLSVFRLFSLFSVGVQSIISLVDLAEGKHNNLPYTGPLFLLVFTMPILNGLWGYYSRKVDDYMGVEHEFGLPGTKP